MSERWLNLIGRTRGLPLMVQAAGAATVICAALTGQFGFGQAASHYPFLLFFGANAANAFLWRGRVVFPLVAVGGVAASYFFGPEAGSLPPADPFNALALIAFLAMGVGEVVLVNLLVDALLAARRANMELQGAMAALRRSEGDKATLLADADHRIKNNLQLMASLLQLESMQADGGRELLQAAASRMAIMGRVHEMLSHAIGREVSARPFIDGLCADLARSLSDGKQVKIEVAAEDVVLTGRTATLLGLLINELVTNAMKHAFPSGALGSVKVILSREDERVRLVVADDGVGLAGAGSGIGSRLANIIAADLGGELHAESDRGAKFTLSFPDVGRAHQVATAGASPGIGREANPEAASPSHH